MTPAGYGPWRDEKVPGFKSFSDLRPSDSVSSRFVEAAEAFSERQALASPSARWSYGELLTEVAALAALLDAVLGDSAPVAVCILSDHDGPLVQAILAVMMAGHIVVVLDPMAPQELTDHVVTESGSTVILHDDAHEGAARSHAETAGGHVKAVAFGSAGHDELPVARPAPALTLDSPAMLAFTSGSSGEPKGAVITHGLLLNLVRGATNALGLSSDDRLPMLFPTSLAVAAYPMFLPLLNGGTLATLDVRSVGLAPIGAFLEDEGITVAYLAPTVVRFLVDALEDRTFPDLRMVALGGEGIDEDAVALTDRLFTPDHIAIGYGTTETGVVSLDVRPRREAVSGPVSCGYAVPDVELFVLDDAGILILDGGAGEIAVSSPYNFAGYVGHPDLDLQVLSEDPSGRAGWRLYRTGDVGRLDGNGALIVTGRIDSTVKIRGRMVVLGDVEADLRSDDAVSDVAVVSVERGGIIELGACVVLVDDSVESSELRRRLLISRESYRVPSHWSIVPKLPQLPNGKTDRQAVAMMIDAAVPAATGSGRRPAAAATPVRTDERRTRNAIRHIWMDLLAVSHVDGDDDFFELGGDSLRAAQMLIEVERRLGVTIPMGRLVGHRTLSDLVDICRDLDSRDRPSSATCLQTGDPSVRPPLWFVHDLQGSAFRVRHLAAALGADQAVWSFESPLLRGIANPYGQLEEFVADYVADLLAAQPVGPYWLAGYSFGGICAYEMARQLRSAGREVAFVGVVDVGPGYRGPGWHGSRSPFRPWFGVAKPPPPGSSLSQQSRHYADMVRASPRGAARHLMVRSGLARLVDPHRFAADLRKHGRIRPSWRLWYAWEEHWKLAATAWDRANSYEGRVDLFWADETPGSDESMGWSPLVGELVVHDFRGDHEGILEERGVADLAVRLRLVLDELMVG